MDGPIISHDVIRAKARSAYKRGAPREGHNFNWHTIGAIEVWQDEWDRCAAAESAVLKVKPMLAQAGSNPP
jgi:hypothetical protein